MADWYVRKSGSDNNGGSSAGTSPDRNGSDMGTTNGSTQVTSASAAFVAGDVGKGINISGVLYRIATFTNSTTIQLERVYAGTTGSGRVWAIGGALLTVNKMLNTAAAVIQGGDTLWIGAGVYRETITCGLTSPGSELIIAGDVDGTKTGDSGAIEITAYTSGDASAPVTPAVLALSGKDNLTFKNILWVTGNSGSSIGVDANTPTSQSIKFLNCAFLLGHSGNKLHIGVTSAFNTSLDWVIDRCIFINGNKSAAGSHINVTCTTGVGADYDVNFIIRNSIFIGGGVPAILVVNSGTAANKGNGVKIKNCSLFGCGAIVTTATQISTTIPSTINNCFIYSGFGTAITAGTSGQITEDYNFVNATTVRTNVTAGANTVSGFAPKSHFGQERIWGGLLRLFGEPMSGSPLLNFGNDGNQTSYDLRNNPRPAGGGLPAAGALERSNTWVKETSTVRTGSNALSCVGPGYQDFLVPVDVVSTTIAVYMRFDSTYTGTKPQVQVLNGTECGVTDATSSAVTTVDTWEQLSLSFTPTSKGIVTIRLLSSDTNGGGKAFADDFSVA